MHIENVHSGFAKVIYRCEELELNDWNTQPRPGDLVRVDMWSTSGSSVALVIQVYGYHRPCSYVTVLRGPR